MSPSSPSNVPKIWRVTVCKFFTLKIWEHIPRHEAQVLMLWHVMTICKSFLKKLCSVSQSLMASMFPVYGASAKGIMPCSRAVRQAWRRCAALISPVACGHCLATLSTEFQALAELTPSEASPEPLHAVACRCHRHHCQSYGMKIYEVHLWDSMSLWTKDVHSVVANLAKPWTKDLPWAGAHLQDQQVETSQDKAQGDSDGVNNTPKWIQIIPNWYPLVHD